jgi:hypothetical protein
MAVFIVLVMVRFQLSVSALFVSKKPTAER